MSRPLLAAFALPLALLAVPASAQTPVFQDAQDGAQDSAAQDSSLFAADPLEARRQDFCIQMLDGFPNDDPVVSYSFFKLAQDMGADTDAPTLAMIDRYSGAAVASDTPVMDVLEQVADPVLRQAQPAEALSGAAHIIHFASACEGFLAGQVDSLLAFDPTLADVEFNALITEDALYLRQLVSEALSRLGADTDPDHRATFAAYTTSLLAQRGAMEFATFEAGVEEVERVFLVDLDGRLARSNDLINGAMNREVMADAQGLVDDLNRQEELARRQRRQFILIRILTGA